MIHPENGPKVELQIWAKFGPWAYGALGPWGPGGPLGGFPVPYLALCGPLGHTTPDQPALGGPAH